jgi:RHS repeat-associated protein
MITRAFQCLLIVILFAVAVENTPGQVVTGLPPYSSIAGGPADNINLANLNVHLTFPVLHKSGRGLPVSMDLTYDTTFWYPASNGVNLYWNPILTGGWSDTMTSLGGTYFSAVVSGSTVYFCDFVYFDGQGTAHFFPGPNPNICPANTTSTYPVVVAATDGSGYQLTITGCSVSGSTATCNGYLNSREGNYIAPPVNTANGVGYVKDRNGNTISEDSSGHFTDTLGTVALTVAGIVTPTQPNPVTYTYTAPSGAAAAVTQVYGSHTVQTNFGCGIAEYGPQTASLVDKVTLADGSYYQLTYEATPSHAGNVTGRLASIKLPTGGTISYTYTGVNCNDGTTWGLIRATPDGTWHYQRYTNSNQTAYITTVIDPLGNETIIHFQGIYETQRDVYQGSGPTITAVPMTESSLQTSNLLQETQTCYNASVSPCTATAITLPITKRSVTIQPGQNAKLAKKVYSYPSDGSGVLLEEDDYDYGTGAPGALLKKTVYTYASLGAIKSFPATVTVCAPGGTAASCNGSGTVVSQTTNKYDESGTLTTTTGTPQLQSVPGQRGNLTTTQSLVQGTTLLTKHISYYDTGNINTITDVNGTQQPSYTYGTGSCGNSFPTTISEGLGLSETLTWDCTGGVQTSVTDENGKKTSTVYSDPYFWRPASKTDPANAVTSFTYASKNTGEISMTFNSNSSISDFTQTFDGLGRTSLQQRKQSPGATNFDTVETDYDGLGMPRRTTVPYLGTLGQTNASAPGEATVRDAMGRVLSVTDAGTGTTTNTYKQNDVLVVSGPAPTGENSKQRQMEYDGLGRLASVCEITSATGSGTCGQTVTQTGYWTKYTYDVLGNLTGVIQNAQAAAAQQQTRSYVYDGLSRLTSETNPESATTTYVYDTDSTCGTSAGDKVKRMDAVGNTTCYVYDALHRNTSITYSGPYAASTPNKYFVYDAATIATTPTATAMVNVKGRIAEAYTATCQTCAKSSDMGYSYSTRGEVSDIYQATPHSSGYYHLNALYWANGLPSQVSGSLGVPTLNYGVDGEGRTNSTSTSALTLVSGVTYNAASQPTQLNLGTGDFDAYGYDPNTTRMTQYKFNLDSQSVIGNLTWNANSTLKQLAVADPFNTSNNQTCTYGYDDLKRVSSVGCTPPGSTTATTWQQSFSYDPFGNISKSGSMSFQPTYTDSNGHTNNKYTSVPGCTVSYDANGNVLNDCTHTYAWDAEGRPVATDGVSVTYDALKRMVEQNRSGAYTQIVFAPTGEKFALMNGQTLRKAFVPLPGKLTAIYTTTGFGYYRHKDWLGSSRFASTATLSTTAGRGTSTVNGAEQSKTVGAAAGTGTGTVSGSEQSVVGSGTHSSGSYSLNWYLTSFNSPGQVTLYINGSQLASANFSSGEPGDPVALALVNQINANSSALVTASGGGNNSGPGTVNVTSKATGSTTNYPLSITCTLFGGGSCSSNVSASGMFGGTGGTTTYDTGSVWITINGAQTTVSYGQNSTTATLASSMVTAINGNSSLPVTATLSGSIVSLTAKTTGSNTNYTLTSGSSTSQPGTFSSPSFTVGVSGATLTGGSNGTLTYDTGTVWVTVNGVQTSASYGQGTTSLTLASSLASAVNGNSSSPVSATVSGSLLVLVAKTNGTTTNYTFSAGSSTSQPGTFTNPSFTVAVSGSALTGGSASATSMYSSTAYAPFGETYAQAGTADPVFAGLNQDTSGGLYDADAREYGIQGRWPSPDPAGTASIHTNDPQTLNRYAYSRNNPISLADPSGKDWCDWFGGCDGGGGGGMGCDWDPSCFGGSLPNPLGGLPDPFGIANYPMPGMGCDWGCLSNDGSGEGGGDGSGGAQKTAEQCVANDVNKYLKGKTDSQGNALPNDPFNVSGSSPEVGGHYNAVLTADGLTPSQADAIYNALQQCDDQTWGGCIGPQTRLDGGNGLHAEQLGAPQCDANGNCSVTIAHAHKDLYDPNADLAGLFGHGFVDYLWGHLVQWFNGDLDDRC